MRKRICTAFLAALCLLGLGGCGAPRGADQPPPDLEGHWTQISAEGTNYYQTARIWEDKIQVYWHVSQDDSEYLYWTGSFVPPENGAEPYTWVSETNLTHEEYYPRCRREETLSFTYEDGKLSYIEIQGRIRMKVALEKDAEPETAAE